MPLKEVGRRLPHIFELTTKTATFAGCRLKSDRPEAAARLPTFPIVPFARATMAIT